MPVSPLGEAYLNTAVRIAGVDTKPNIIDIGSNNNALHGRMYLPTNANEVYIGAVDGSLIRVGGGSSWIATDNGGASTFNVSPITPFKFSAGSGLTSVITADGISYGINTTGASNGKVLGHNGSTILWVDLPVSYITNILDTNSIDLTVSSGVLSADVKISSNSNNRLSVTPTGLYSAGYTAGSGISIVGNTISVNELSLVSVHVDTTYTTIGAFATNVYDGNNFQEGDVIVLSNANPSETWIHNGGTAGTDADFTKISSNLSQATVRSYFSGTSPITYNSSTGVIGLGGLLGYGTTGYVIASTGSGLAYTDPNSLITAIKTIQKDGSTISSGRTTMNFSGAGFTVTDVSSRINVSLHSIINDLTSIVGTGIAVRTGSGWVVRTMVQPSAGFTITNPSGTDGNITFTLANDLAAIEAISSTGFAVRTGTDTWVTRQITGTSNRVSVSNPAGASGNVIIDIDSAYVGQSSITTVGTITTGTWNGGVIPLEYGGTATSLSDPGETAIVFWDDVNNKMDFLELGSGLEIVSGVLTLESGSDTNPWYTVNTGSKANSKTGSIWHNGSVVIGDAETSYTVLGSGTALNVLGDLVSVGGSGTRGLILQDSTNAYWKVTILPDGSLITNLLT